MSNQEVTLTQEQRRKVAGFALALLGCLTLSSMAVAQTGPLAGKKLRIVVGFSPGGGVDGLARAVAEGLTRSGGAQVVHANTNLWLMNDVYLKSRM